MNSQEMKKMYIKKEIGEKKRIELAESKKNVWLWHLRFK